MSTTPATTMEYGALFDKAWGWIRDQLPLVAGLTLVYGVALGVCSLLPIVGHFAAMAIGPGYLVCLLKIRDRQNMDFADFFWTFTDFNRLLHFYLMFVIQWILICVGFILLVIPGVYLAVALSLSSTYFVLREQDGIQSLKKAKALTEGHWWFLAGLFLLIGVLNILGALFFLIGLLITLPLSVLVAVAALEALERKTPVSVIDVAATPLPQ